LPISGVRVDLADSFGHEPLNVAMNECAAWRLAQFLGDPYESLVPSTVFRYHHASQADRVREPDLRDGWGAMSARQVGTQLDLAPLRIPDINDAAAFFDVLIANQDRNLGNFRWDGPNQKLGLFDHGFTFPRRSARRPFNTSAFLEQRHAPPASPTHRRRAPDLGEPETALDVG
jgi:hypothetical protein